MHCYPLGYLSSTPRSSFAIYGIITDDSQAEALKKEIQSEVDAIMNTFETKKLRKAFLISLRELRNFLLI